MAFKKSSSLSYQQSHAARAVLTLSQKSVIDQTGIQAYKLKQFEAKKYRLDAIEQKKLRDFYEAQGVDFDEIDANLKAQQDAEKADLNEQRGIAPSAGAGFLISDDVTQDQVDSVLDRMEENDAKIAELIGTTYSTGFFGSSEESEAALRELFGLLAESHLLFRFLQGKNIVEPVKKNPKTVGDMLAQWMKGSPAYCVIGLPDSGSASTPKAAGPQKIDTSVKAKKATALANDVDGEDDGGEE